MDVLNTLYSALYIDRLTSVNDTSVILMKYDSTFNYSHLFARLSSKALQPETREIRKKSKKGVVVFSTYFINSFKGHFLSWNSLRVPFGVGQLMLAVCFVEFVSCFELLWSLDLNCYTLFTDPFGLNRYEKDYVPVFSHN